MKQKRWIILLYLLMGISTAIVAQEAIENTDSIPPPINATMLFDRDSYHLGTIKDNTKPTTYSFFYCNIGQQGLLIKRIESTCGCTVTQYPTDSLFYDESGQIDIEIAPCSEAGPFKKGIYVYTNAGTFRLVVSGEFAFADYSQEDYSAIPTIEEEKQQLLLHDESTNRGIDESKKKEKSNKKEKRKKKH